MSTLGLRFRLPERISRATSRVPRPLRLAFYFLFGSAVLTALLLAHALSPYQPNRVAAIFLASLVGLALARFHVQHTPIVGVPRQVSERILWLTTILAIAGLQLGMHSIDPSSNNLGIGFLTLTPLV